MRNHRAFPVRNRAFALVELILVVVVIGMLLAVWSASLNRVREKTYITLDLANFRQVLKASAIYNSDNNDYMAHPTWGSIPSGPDGWAYITQNQGRLPGLPSSIPTCEGRDVDSVVFTNQVAFFSKGQVTQYLEDGVKTTWCPKDVTTRERGTLRSAWRQRALKVTSYSWNATVAGLAGRDGQTLGAGKTYKISQFRPTDWLMWETDETDFFNFNDAADHPEQELASRRHLGRSGLATVSQARSAPGGAVVGLFGGTAHLVQWSKVWDFANRKVPAPNDLLNGPGYR